MDMHLAVTGAIPFVLIAAALLSIPVSWLLLRNYRKAVLRFMNRMNKNADVEKSSKAVKSPKFPLNIKWLASEDVQQVTLDRKAWQLAMVHGLAGLLLALVMRLGAMLCSGIVISALRTWLLFLK